MLQTQQLQREAHAAIQVGREGTWSVDLVNRDTPDTLYDHKIMYNIRRDTELNSYLLPILRGFKNKQKNKQIYMNRNIFWF